MNGHPVLAVAFHPNQSLVATGGGSFGTRQFGRGEVRLWDAATLAPVGPTLSGEGVVHGLTFMPDGGSLIAAKADGAACGRLLATGDDGRAEFWDTATGLPVGPPLKHPAPLLTLSFSADGRRLLTCCGDEMARLWNVPSPLSGDGAHLKNWIEALTKNALDESKSVRTATRGLMISD